MADCLLVVFAETRASPLWPRDSLPAFFLVVKIMSLPQSAEALADSLDLSPLSDLVLQDLSLKVNPIEIVRLALQATEAVLGVYKLSANEWSIEYKGGKEPLTKADLEANKVSSGFLASVLVLTGSPCVCRSRPSCWRRRAAQYAKN